MEKSITTVSLQDLDAAGFDTTNVSEETVTRIAGMMEDSYLEDGYWHDLRAAANKLNIPKKKKVCMQ